MQDADKGSGPALSGQGLRVALVRARFNEPITRALAEACRAELLALGVTDIAEHTVPGALEVAPALAWIAAAGRADAAVALGCVIRGETYHFELVCNESGAGVTRVALDHGLPVANAILTVENEAQAWARTGEKGRDAARVAVEMALLRRSLA